MSKPKPESLQRRGQASAQISLTRAPWADPPLGGNPPLGGSSSGTLQQLNSEGSQPALNPESLEAQEKAPWADASSPASAGTGIDRMSMSSASAALPQAPTRAPWADATHLEARSMNASTSGYGSCGGLGGSTSSMSAGLMPQSSAFPAGGNNSAAWHSRQQESSYQSDLDVKAAMPALTLDRANLTKRAWERPTKRILSSHDLRRWLNSESAQSFVGFITALNEGVRGKKLSDVAPSSPTVDALVKVLDTLEGWIDQIPAVSQSLRYGNPAFRTWHARAVAKAPELMATVLPAELAEASKELGLYLTDSLGNATRIDYGTGHETTFVALLYCLCVLDCFGEEQAQALVTVVFAKYLQLMRRVQKTYWLEPAGSHGVWGLDDYHFLPFLWGSSQLMGHLSIRPASISHDDVLAMYSDDYLYLSAVKFVKEVKKGPLGETSPMLNDISGVPTWGKVNAGMIKMYQAEVLGKFPIMQHMLFGSLLTFPDTDA